MNKMRRKILCEIITCRMGALTKSELMKRLDIPKKHRAKLEDMLSEMKKFGELRSTKGGLWYVADRRLFFKAQVRSVNPKSGFLMAVEGGIKEDTDRDILPELDAEAAISDKPEANARTGDFEEYFVRGKDLLGAIPGDIVIAKAEPIQEEGKSKEAVVLGIIEKSDCLLMGTAISKGKRLVVYPDKLCDAPLEIAKICCGEVKNGDRVAFSVRKRGESHYDHLVDIRENFGSDNSAQKNAEAYMLVNALSVNFPPEVLEEAKGFDMDEPDPRDINGRLDLRGEAIFTIDGADTKDIDDAVSIERTDKGYKLGVHIADVSHYVKKHSKLNEEAFKRGTSIYYADKVVAMLPKELSNGICSLNPNVDRLAFSCIMEVSKQGELLSYRFDKSVIKSRVKGVYTEVNKLLDNTADDEIKSKYSEVANRLPIMQELAEILYSNRVNRGAPEIDTPEVKIITDENGVCVDVKARERGNAEKIIEEFMLMANRSAASLAVREKIPFVYRVHEAPKPEKLVTLNETLTALGVEPEGIGEKSTAADLARIIRKSRGTDKYNVINNIVLRTMMKAKYSENPLGHFGLVMQDYSHFTSPIRRYSDLAVHRILSDYIGGVEHDSLVKKHEKFAEHAAFQASVTELAAINCERECESFYIAEYMQKRVDEEFDGFISGVTPSGIFVELSNTVEGMIPVSKLPAGEYAVQHNVILTGAANGTIFTVGDKIRVKCVSASVSGGFVDFEIVKFPLDEPKKQPSKAQTEPKKRPSSFLDELIK